MRGRPRYVLASTLRKEQMNNTKARLYPLAEREGPSVPDIGQTISCNETTVSTVIFHRGGGRAEDRPPVATKSSPKAS